MCLMKESPSGCTTCCAATSRLSAVDTSDVKPWTAVQERRVGLAWDTVVQEGCDDVVGNVVPQQHKLLPDCFNRHSLRGDLRMQHGDAHLRPHERRFHAALHSSLNYQCLDAIIQDCGMRQEPIVRLMEPLVTVSSFARLWRTENQSC